MRAARATRTARVLRLDNECSPASSLQVTGFYAVSSLLLIRKNVPLAYRAGMDAAMGGHLDFQFFHRRGQRG
jgi:hypothetical protein